MTWLDVVLSIALVINLASAGLNFWTGRRRARLITEQAEQLVAFSKCVALVVFLSTEESGAPDTLRATCQALIPPGVSWHLEKGHSRVH